jgi:hypothetical protein
MTDKSKTLTSVNLLMEAGKGNCLGYSMINRALSMEAVALARLQKPKPPASKKIRVVVNPKHSIDSLDQHVLVIIL